MSRTHEDCLIDVSARVLAAMIGRIESVNGIELHAIDAPALAARAVDLAVALLAEVDARLCGRK